MPVLDKAKSPGEELYNTQQSHSLSLSLSLSPHPHLLVMATFVACSTGL